MSVSTPSWSFASHNPVRLVPGSGRRLQHVHHETDAVDAPDDRSVRAPISADLCTELDEAVGRDVQRAAHREPAVGRSPDRVRRRVEDGGAVDRVLDDPVRDAIQFRTERWPGGSVSGAEPPGEGARIAPIWIEAGSPASSRSTTSNAKVAMPDGAGPAEDQLPYSSKCASWAHSTNSRVVGHQTFSSSNPHARWLENASTTETAPSL
jgi:hypothetical protein